MIDETVRIAKSSNISHSHDEEETTFGMDANTKKAIEHIFIMGTKTALSIKYALFGFPYDFRISDSDTYIGFPSFLTG